MVSRVIPVDTFDLVIFGGTGDLARRKIFPGLYRRYLSGQMNGESRIIGAARAKNTAEQFRAMIHADTKCERLGCHVMIFIHWG